MILFMKGLQIIQVVSSFVRTLRNF